MMTSFDQIASRPRVLISTFVHDQTAAVVATALESIGCDVQRWMMADYPQRQSLSLSIGDDQPDALHASGPALERDFNRFDVYWRRRYHNPVVDADRLHPADAKVARRETQAFVTAAAAMLAPQALHINAEPAARRSDNKLLQLRTARAVGLAIPDTLVSNDPAQIRRFIAERPRGEVVHKHLRGHDWHEGERAFGAYTARVTSDDLPEDALLRALPGVFQVAVPKALEIRAVFFGAQCLAAAIDSSQFESGRDDWRAIPNRRGAWRPHVLPPALVARVVSYIRETGLVFGSADLILKPDGDYVFLELNEQGQFLWLEQDCPDLPILDSFCRLAVDGEHFPAKARSFAPLSLHDAAFGYDPLEALKRRDVERHLINNRNGAVPRG